MDFLWAEEEEGLDFVETLRVFIFVLELPFFFLLFFPELMKESLVVAL